MENTNISPIYEAHTSQRYGHEAVFRIHNLEGAAEVVVSADDGESLVVPAKFLSVLSSVSGTAQSNIMDAIDMLRRKENHPTLHSEDLMAIRRVSRWSSTQDEFAIDTPRTPSSAYEPTLSMILCKQGAQPNQDGTPYMEWAHDENTQEHGWRLRVSGIPNVNISWAVWNDAEGIREAVQMLDDPESCQVIAGVVDPTLTAQMASRVAARALRSGRKLPGINMGKVKKVFAAHSETLFPKLSEEQSQSTYRMAQYRPEAKVFSVPSGDRKVPVAVAIIPPRVFPAQARLSDDDRRGMNYKKVQEFEEKAYLAELTPWQETVTEVFSSEGWRTVSLPKPRYAWGMNYQSVQWFTLLSEEQWSTVAPAAKNYASSEFSLSRTTGLTP